MATLLMKIYKPEMAPIKVPKRFIITHQPPTGVTLEALIMAYQTVFKEALYWKENWSRKAVQAKIRKEICNKKTSFLVTIRGDEEMPVAGFAWGAILNPTELKYRVSRTLKKPLNDFNDLVNSLFARHIDKLVYADEFAIVARFRNGIDPVRGLLQPWLEWAWFENQISSCMFWTTPASPIYKLCLYMGWEPIFWTKDGSKDIVFILNQDFRPLLKICQNLDTRKIARLMIVAERILNRRKKTK